jgi:hypothetical protein
VRNHFYNQLKEFQVEMKNLSNSNNNNNNYSNYNNNNKLNIMNKIKDVEKQLYGLTKDLEKFISEQIISIKNVILF